MCGIAGIFKPGSTRQPEESAIHRMCEAIVHRGPDDEGIYLHEGVGLGMRRLSIIDLAGGHQPIHNEDKNVWVVFNGEIYNFKELRQKLEARGHRFYTNTDTEVIVHLYEDRGPDFVQELRGMFAIALYDARSGRLLLVRDRLGIKPLHYGFHQGALFFGSEIKAIFAGAPGLVETNKEALLSYLYFGYIPDPNTAFRGIYKLPPGHILEVANGRQNLRQYWDLPEFGTYNPNSEEECLGEMEQRLDEAVRIRLISDVPLGALLSGGTDSSVVVALMARANSAPVKTFSIGFAHSDFDETNYAREVARTFGTEHHEIVFDPKISDLLDYLTQELEEPFGDSSILPTYYVSKLARQHVTVALSGDGGDELFGGYERYRIHKTFGVSERIPKWLGRSFRKHMYPLLPHGMLGRRFLYNYTLASGERYLDLISFQPQLDRHAQIISPEFLQSLNPTYDPLNLFRNYLKTARTQGPLSQLMYLDTKTYLPADILTKVDRMSMITSLEVRVPILDHVFVEWVSSLSSSWKFRGSNQKYIFKKLAEKLRVPQKVIYRPKKGFALPLMHWMRHELKEELTRVLLEPRTLQRGYFEPEAIRVLLKEHFGKRRDHSGSLWRLLVFELWHRNYLEQMPSRSTARQVAVFD